MWSGREPTELQRIDTATMLDGQASERLPKHQINSIKRLQTTLKRLLDVALSASALVLFLPVFLAIAIAIKLESRGPALFIQERWGKDQKKIQVFKFRSMYLESCDASGVQQTIAGDARITRVGRFLRASNLDELPQLINILSGDMSFVGPRCHPVGMLAAGMRYEELVPGYHLRHAVKPGLTGLAQINGLRGPTTDAEKAITRIRYDRLYVRNASIWLDMRIIGQTLIQELRGGSGF